LLFGQLARESPDARRAAVAALSNMFFQIPDAPEECRQAVEVGIPTLVDLLASNDQMTITGALTALTNMVRKSSQFLG
jgi:hypothetical protein